MGASHPGHPVRPARRNGGPVALGLCALILLGLSGGEGAASAALDEHAEAHAALADARAAVAEIVRAENTFISSPVPYHKAAHRAINALVGERSRDFDAGSGNPGDAAGALGHIDRLLDRRETPRWADPLHGAQANLLAAVSQLHDALQGEELSDYQLAVTDALLSLEMALGRPTEMGALGGLTGALATTTLGVPAGAPTVSACEPPAEAPAYGVEDGYLAFVTVPAAKGTADLPEDFGSRDVTVSGDRLIVRTAAAKAVAALCEEARSHAAAAGSGERTGTAPSGSVPALYTRTQAEAGAGIYSQHCVSCHGKNLQGSSGPSVAGEDFLTTAQHNGWTLEVIQYLVVNNMPFNNPGSLSPKQYADVMAFLLASNCYPAGQTPFPEEEEDRFAKLQLGPVPGAHPDNPRLGVCEVR